MTTTTNEDGEIVVPEGGMDAEGLKLLVAVVNANVRMASDLTNRLLDYEQSQSLDLARGFLGLYDALREATQVVTTKPLEAALNAMSGHLSLAEATVERLSKETEISL